MAFHLVNQWNVNLLRITVVFSPWSLCKEKLHLFPFPALGVIILVGVLVDCCVRSTKEEYAYEKKVFIDVNKTQRYDQDCRFRLNLY